MSTTSVFFLRGFSSSRPRYPNSRPIFLVVGVELEGKHVVVVVDVSRQVVWGADGISAGSLNIKHALGEFLPNLSGNQVGIVAEKVNETLQLA